MSFVDERGSGLRRDGVLPLIRLFGVPDGSGKFVIFRILESVAGEG